MSINRVCISGNLTRDPELRQTAGGMAILNMRMAVNDRRKNSSSGEWEDVANYVDVVTFGNRAESLSRFLGKGSRITVDGKLRWSEWADKTSGDKRQKIEVVADDIELPARSESHAQSAPAAFTPPAADDDDVPFHHPERIHTVTRVDGHEHHRARRAISV